MKKTTKPSKNIQFTSRDLSILSFVYEQKFSSLEVIDFNFFAANKKLLNQPHSPHFYAARKRLQALVRHGLLKMERVFSESKSLYLITKLGYTLLQRLSPQTIYAPHSKSIDFRNYDHDSNLNILRSVLTKSSYITEWYPERKIRVEGFIEDDGMSHLPKKVIPDAIATSVYGQTFAVELEQSQRMKSRFQTKVELLGQAIDNPDSQISGALFVCCTKSLNKTLSEITKGLKGFKVHDFQQYKRCFLENDFKPSFVSEVSHAK